MESKVALVIIYNHQYNKNIEVVERIYKGRFSDIYHLVPFYNGEKSNVIAVYCSSIYFEGYIAQGFKSYFKEKYNHYFFIGDDLILNPLINENNYCDYLKLSDYTCFMPRLSPVNEGKDFWGINFYAMLYDVKSPGVEAAGQVPDYHKAEELLRNHGIENNILEFNQIWEKPRSIKEWFKKLSVEGNYIPRYIKNKVTKKKYRLTYPLVRSYSDIFVVSSDAIKLFCHYCGVFSATRLFVELAIPTAMAFSAKEINTEKDIELKGTALWTQEEMKQLDQYDHNLQKLLNDFPRNNLYLHPVKLSKWNTQL